MARDPVAASLEELEPQSRALLELSFVRGVEDEDVAALLSVPTEGVRERREAVLAGLGVRSSEDRAALERALRGEPEPEPEQAEREWPRFEPEPAGVAEPARRTRGGRRAGTVALLGGLVVALAVAVALALGDDEEDGGGDPVAQAPAGDGGGPGGGGEEPLPDDAGVLRALGELPAQGRAVILAGEGARPRLRLTVSGLPRPESGGYVVWLYNSITDARALTGSRSGNFTVRAPLPASAERFRFLDVSREPPDGNRNHSGASVLRVPLDRIPEG